MVISVSGRYYVFKTVEIPTRDDLKQFFSDLSENDILEVQNADGKRIHVTRYFLDNNLNFVDLTIPKTEDTFKLAASMPYDVIMPVMDSNGQCVSILKKIWTYYKHYYHYDAEPDLSFLNRYDCICLMKINEYSVVLYQHAISRWQGKRVFLVGEEWLDYLDLLPRYEEPQVTILPELTDEVINDISHDYTKVLYINEFLPTNDGISRYHQGIMSYDEIMTLTFLFSYVIHPGSKNPDKKFFLIDGYFRIEGLFGVWTKVFTAARYALAKGYLPVFEIVSSDDNMYSDYTGDDIWNKFFLQPGGYTLAEVHESSYLALSPNMNILTGMRYLMDEVSADITLQWPSGIFNNHVRTYIKERQQIFLPFPKKTLGVLIRGTDYINNPLPNHPKHVSMETVVAKIHEVEKEWGFDFIYLATEDSNICNRMKELYGDRISFTDQERFSLPPGQLLVSLHEEKKKGKGFRLGAEYLCSLNLLSHCDSFIASGFCSGTTEALRENAGAYRHVYIFESKEPAVSSGA